MSSGSYQKSPSAQPREIALDENEEDRTNVDEEKLSNKSASLKRFFKMSQKKLDGAMSGDQLSKKDPDNDELEDNASNETKPKSQSALRRRFELLNFGPKSSDTVDSMDVAGSSSMASNSATSSMSTLKSSISSYWHTVFKRHRSNSGADSSASTANIFCPTTRNIGGSTISSNTVLGNSVVGVFISKADEFSTNDVVDMREDVHTLSISQEP